LQPSPLIDVSVAPIILLKVEETRKNRHPSCSSER
jgi:hypothetical protein